MCSPLEVVEFLGSLGGGGRAVYEAGPAGFGLARAARERGIGLEVIAPGSIPKGPTDRVKTDRRDAVRLARLLAAGELRFAFVPSVADERFRDLTRSIEDVRGDLMRARHRLSRFLLRRGERYGGPGSAWTAAHLGWLRRLEFDDHRSRASFADSLAAIELLVGRRASPLAALDQAVPASSHAPVIARLRCFRGIDTLSAAGLAAEIGDFARSTTPSLLSGLLGIVPSERTSDQKRRQGSITKAGSTHARRLLVEPHTTTVVARSSVRRSLVDKKDRIRVSSPSPAPASSPPFSGRPQPLTDRSITSALRGASGAARDTREGPQPSHEGSRLRWATGTPAAPDPRQRAATNTGS